jgi:hypothetical protein
MEYFFTNQNLLNTLTIDNAYSQLSFWDIRNDLKEYLKFEGIVYSENVSERYQTFIKNNQNNNNNIFLHFFCPFWKTTSDTQSNLEISINFTHKSEPEDILTQSKTAFELFFQIPDTVKTLEHVFENPTDQENESVILNEVVFSGGITYYVNFLKFFLIS